VTGSPLRINVVTIFPEFFREPLATSIPGRAARAGLVEYRLFDLRDFTEDRHRTVDDVPYGGGAGMVMKPEPFFKAVESFSPQGPVILLSPRGRVFAHDDAVRLSLEAEISFLCGHYKDVDQRVAEHLATEELSLGDFVLSGGEIAALAITDAVVRLLPGALGDHGSASSDSFYDGPLLSPPSWTRPPEYRGWEVPEILRGGDHGRIEAFRREMAERVTRERRPDLWARALEGGWVVDGPDSPTDVPARPPESRSPSRKGKQPLR
jgi:tRNA (guanine37-N1)-methyltransferase